MAREDPAALPRPSTPTGRREDRVVSATRSRRPESPRESPRRSSSRSAYATAATTAKPEVSKGVERRDQSPRPAQEAKPSGRPDSGVKLTRTSAEIPEKARTARPP